MQLTSAPAVIKEVEYDYETRDYAAYVAIDGAPRQCIGYGKTHSQADDLCNEYAYNFYADNHTPEVAAALAVEMSEAEIALTLPETIALTLTGTTDPTCELCSAPAFVSCDGHLYCKAQWQQGKCDEPTPYCFFHPDASDHNTRDCPKVEEPGFGEPSYSVFN